MPIFARRDGWRRKMWACLALAVVAVVVFRGCDCAGSTTVAFLSHEAPDYTTYKDIPGVTNDEIAAIEALREKYRDSVLVYGVMESMESFIGQGGEVSGFTARICNYINELFGFQLKPALFEWGDLVSGLASGEITFTGDLTLTEERRRLTHLMTSPIVVRSIVYYRLEGSPPLAEIAKTRPLRSGFFKGATTGYAVLEAAAEEMEPVYVSEYAEAYEMLKSGQIDAFFEQNTAKAVLDPYGDVVYGIFFPLIYEPASLTTQRPEFAPVIAVMEKLLQAGGFNYLNHLYNLGERDYMANKLFVRLTEEEQAYVSGRPTVRLAAEYDNYPFSFYNTNEKAWQGMTIDILREVEMLTGITFEIANDTRTEFSDLKHMLKMGNAAVITELIRTDDREGRFLWPSTPIQQNKYALISTARHRNIRVSEIMHMRIGVQKNTAFAEQLRRWFPNHGYITVYNGVNDVFDALEREEVDMMMSSQSQIVAATNFMERPGYKINILFDHVLESSLGFNVNERILCEVVDKALKHVDLYDISELWMHKTYDYRVKMMQSRIPLLIVLSASLLCVAILLLILFHRNRTTGKRLEKLVEVRSRDLAEALESAKVASRAKSMFLANMSHEIRTPMNSVIGFAELALDYDVPDMPREYVGKILENSKWLLQIINDILDVSKIEAGKATLESIPFALCDIFSHCQMITVPRAAEKGIVLYFYAEPFVGKKLVGDPTKLAQIFINLVSNAIKFTNVGTVKVSSTIVEKSDSSIRLNFEVKDSGIGMTPDEIRRIFEPFAQANESIARKFGGTGLGLSIIKAYIELMGGKLLVESAPDIGSKFSFNITFDMVDTPVDDAADSAGIEAKPIEKPTLSGEVLVCEDNGMNQEIIRRHLERVGLQMVIADNGKIGIDMIKNRLESGKRLFDLILMDINMPVMDGIEASTNILELNIGVPIVAMTANVMPDDRNLYGKSGMHDYIGKPFTSQELWRCLLKYLKPADGGITQKSEEPEAAAAYSEEDSFYDDDLLLELQTHFVSDNQSRFAEFADALKNNDIKLAHRIAHTLKGNAATIGKTALERAAHDAELALSGGKNLVTEKQMGVLNAELDKVLRELSPLLAKEDDSDIQPSIAFSSLTFLDELGDLLRKGSSNSLKYTDALRAVVGCEKLIRQIEHFDFDDAFQTFTALRKSVEGVG